MVEGEAWVPFPDQPSFPDVELCKLDHQREEEEGEEVHHFTTGLVFVKAVGIDLNLRLNCCQVPWALWAEVVGLALDDIPDVHCRECYCR